MVNEDLRQFMDHLSFINKDIAEYRNEETGTDYIVPTSYVWCRCDYLELTNEELKKEIFSQNINKTDLKFNYIETTRPAPKYEQTKRDEDKYTIIDAKVMANQVWVVSNGLKFKNTFNNKEDALKLLKEINEPLKRYFE